MILFYLVPCLLVLLIGIALHLLKWCLCLILWLVTLAEHQARASFESLMAEWKPKIK